MILVAGLNSCNCPVSIDAVNCGECGGLLLPLDVLSKIDVSLQQWFCDLDSGSRLNQTFSGSLFDE
jgi:hypothetical protein